jgi:glycosyltransferase involved in cell wall biosynthesis
MHEPTTAPTKKLKVAVITCYNQVDYVRARNLRTAFGKLPNVDMVVLKNKQTGILRYPEVALKLLKMRFIVRPDVYVVTFRGYEILLYMCLTFVRKPIIFDELVNMIEYFYKEHKSLPAATEGFVGRLYHWMLKRCRIILADTQAHAEYSAKLSNADIGKYRVMPISGDEEAFAPRKSTAKPGDFNVFYYGHGMKKLHGLEYVLDAAVRLKDNSRISFTVIGGKDQAAQACADAKANGAHVAYFARVPFEQLADYTASASLCLGGPFGKTVQSQFVITGKVVLFMAMGRPVLMGQNLASEEHFKDQENALLVPLANGQAIAGTISWAEKHPKELEAIAKAGHKLYETHYSQAVIDDIIAGIVKALT